MKPKKLFVPDNDNIILPISAVKPSDKVFLGMPTRNGMISSGSAQSAMTQVTKYRSVLFRASAHTNLELNYNMLLCDALNLRDRDGVKWFAMLHDDVCPEPYWLDILIDEAEKHNADLMSAHVPLKDMRQVSSTAMSFPGEEWFPYVRLTLKQIYHENFPNTIDTYNAVNALRNLPGSLMVNCPLNSRLLTNTGCMVMRLDRPWMDQVCFHKKDTIYKINDVWNPMTWTEDWMLAEDLHDVGARVMATRKVKLTHFDGKRFFSSEPDVNGQDVDESSSHGS